MPAKATRVADKTAVSEKKPSSSASGMKSTASSSLKSSISSPTTTGASAKKAPAPTSRSAPKIRQSPGDLVRALCASTSATTSMRSIASVLPFVVAMLKNGCTFSSSTRPMQEEAKALPFSVSSYSDFLAHRVANLRENNNNTTMNDATTTRSAINNSSCSNSQDATAKTLMPFLLLSSGLDLFRVCEMAAPIYFTSYHPYFVVNASASSRAGSAGAGGELNPSLSRTYSTLRPSSSSTPSSPSPSAASPASSPPTNQRPLQQYLGVTVVVGTLLPPLLVNDVIHFAASELGTSSEKQQQEQQQQRTQSISTNVRKQINTDAVRSLFRFLVAAFEAEERDKESDESATNGDGAETSNKSPPSSSNLGNTAKDNNNTSTNPPSTSSPTKADPFIAVPLSLLELGLSSLANLVEMVLTVSVLSNSPCVISTLKGLSPAEQKPLSAITKKLMLEHGLVKSNRYCQVNSSTSIRRASETSEAKSEESASGGGGLINNNSFNFNNMEVGSTVGSSSAQEEAGGGRQDHLPFGASSRTRPPSFSESARSPSPKPPKGAAHVTDNKDSGRERRQSISGVFASAGGLNNKNEVTANSSLTPPRSRRHSVVTVHDGELADMHITPPTNNAVLYGVGMGGGVPSSASFVPRGHEASERHTTNNEGEGVGGAAIPPLNQPSSPILPMHGACLPSPSFEEVIEADGASGALLGGGGGGGTKGGEISGAPTVPAATGNLSLASTSTWGGNQLSQQQGGGGGPRGTSTPFSGSSATTAAAAVLLASSHPYNSTVGAAGGSGTAIIGGINNSYVYGAESGNGNDSYSYSAAAFGSNANIDAHEIRLLRAELRDKEHELAVTSEKLKMTEEAYAALRMSATATGLGNTAAAEQTFGGIGIGTESKSSRFQRDRLGGSTSAASLLLYGTGGGGDDSLANLNSNNATLNNNYNNATANTAPHSLNGTLSSLVATGGGPFPVVGHGGSRAASISHHHGHNLMGVSNATVVTSPDAFHSTSTTSRRLDEDQTIEEAIAAILEGGVSGASAAAAAAAAANARLSVKEVELMRLVKAKDTLLREAQSTANDATARLQTTKELLEQTDAKKRDLEQNVKAHEERLASLGEDRGRLWERIVELESLTREYEQREVHQRTRITELEGDNDLLRIQLAVGGEGIRRGSSIWKNKTSSQQSEASDDLFLEEDELRRRAASSHRTFEVIGGDGGELDGSGGGGDGDGRLTKGALEVSELKRQLRAAQLELAIMRQKIALGSSGVGLHNAAVGSSMYGNSGDLSIRHHRNESVLSEGGGAGGGGWGAAAVSIGGYQHHPLSIGHHNYNSSNALAVSSHFLSPPPNSHGVSMHFSSTQRMMKSTRAAAAIADAASGGGNGIGGGGGALSVPPREAHPYIHASPAALTEDGWPTPTTSFLFSNSPAHSTTPIVVFAKKSKYPLVPSKSPVVAVVGMPSLSPSPAAAVSAPSLVSGEGNGDDENHSSNSTNGHQNAGPGEEKRAVVNIATSPKNGRTRSERAVGPQTIAAGHDAATDAAADARPSSITAVNTENPACGRANDINNEEAQRATGPSTATTATTAPVAAPCAAAGTPPAAVSYQSDYPYDPQYQRSLHDIIGKALVIVGEGGVVTLQSPNVHLQEELLTLLEAYSRYIATAGNNKRPTSEANKVAQEEGGPSAIKVESADIVGRERHAVADASGSSVEILHTAGRDSFEKKREGKERGNKCCCVM